jgi:hypothetical protein
MFEITKITKENANTFTLDCEGQSDVLVTNYINDIMVKGKVKFINNQNVLCLNIARLPITDIDLTGFKSLKYLDVSQTKLKELHIYGCHPFVDCDKSLVVKFYDNDCNTLKSIA